MCQMSCRSSLACAYSRALLAPIDLLQTICEQHYFGLAAQHPHEPEFTGYL